jgi:uncharacterized protein YegL
MDKNKIWLGIVLDRSGSMDECKAEAIGGFNRVIEDQKKTAGATLVTVVQFDDLYEVLYDGVLVEQVKPLDSTTFVPRGWTALLDAMGKTINTIGEKLAKMPDDERPAKVIIVTVTDGVENASKEFSHEQVKKMIEHQKEKYGWEFVFVGSEPRAVEYAHLVLGFAKSATVHYASGSAGTSSMFDSLSRGLSHAKSSVVRGSYTGYKHGGDDSDDDGSGNGGKHN